MNSADSDGQPGEPKDPGGSIVSLRLVTSGKSVTLSSASKWRHAIQLGDLTPDTLVEVERGLAPPERHLGRSIGELTALFEEYGFRPPTEPSGSHPAEPAPGASQTKEALDVEQETAPTTRDQKPGSNEPAASAMALSVAGTTYPADRLDSWQDVAAVVSPGPGPVLPNRRKWKGGDKATRARAFRRDARRALSLMAAFLSLIASLAGTGPPVLLLTGCAMFAFWTWPRSRKQERLKLKAAVRSSKDEWRGLLKLWNSSASTQGYDRERSELYAAYQEVEAMERRRSAALVKLDDRSFQMHDHLSKFTVDHQRIPGIGPGRAAALRAAGYRTAADISAAIQFLPGFGPSLTASLQHWRASCEQTFVHEPRRSQKPAEIRRIDKGFAAEKARLSQPMYGAAGRLDEQRIRILASRAELLPKLVDAWDQYQTARLRLRAL